ncbi:MAG: hypothetical protein LBN38_04320 [Verrucomicrobiota bacterium]|nr:hypothetical protein [Verrucomicrobiota bacterium]
MMKTDQKHSMDSRRRGVALIIVLGFLSLMVMLAVAFVIQARIERLVADASLDGMRTRQMAQTAIAAGMQDYLNAILSVPASDTRYDIFLSGMGDSIAYYFSGETMGDERLIVGKAADWLTNEETLTAVSNKVADAQWIWVREEPGRRSRILGRYAYACVDISGYLDANLLGQNYQENKLGLYGATTNRNNIRVMTYDSAFRQTVTGGDQDLLSTYQKNWKGFDTPAALLNLTDGTIKTGSDEDKDRWAELGMNETDPLDVEYLAPYSYAALHRTDGSGNEKYLLSSRGLQNDPDFSRLVNRAEHNISVADVAKALADYESTSVTPVGVDYPSIKNVPMFNEFVVRASIQEGVAEDGAISYALKVEIRPEFWYPFPSEDNERGTLFTVLAPTTSGSFSGGEPSDHIGIQIAPASGEWGVDREALVLGSPTTVPPGAAFEVKAKFNDGNPYGPDGGEWTYVFPVMHRSGEALPSGMQFRVLVNLRNIELQASGTAVDKSPPKLQYNFEETLSAGSPPTDWVSWAVNDPRLNHDENNWIAPDSGNSYGSINDVAISAKEEAAQRGMPPGDYFYCRNGAMETPAELGYFSSGYSWETLNIFSEEGIQLMNRAVSDPDVWQLVDSTNAVFFTNGTINPYTRSTNVLNAAFYGLDKREVPNMPDKLSQSNQLVQANLLDPLVGTITNLTVKDGYAGWSRALTNRLWNMVSPKLNKNQRVALLHNTWGLFNDSDRLFVIFVTAQSIKEGDNPSGLGNWNSEEDMITGERRAVALCWIDGGADGSKDSLSREMNIIMFQYLNE